MLVGAFTLEHALARCDRDGVSVHDVLVAIDYAGEHREPGAVGAYIEAHIEQGLVPDAHDKVIDGLRDRLGKRWFYLTVHGMEAHAGPMPKALRRDLPLVAGDLTNAVNRAALDHAPHGRGTIVRLDVNSNSRNVIPGRAKFSVDLRATGDELFTAMNFALRAVCAHMARRGNAACSPSNAAANPPPPPTSSNPSPSPAAIRHEKDHRGQAEPE